MDIVLDYLKKNHTFCSIAQALAERTKKSFELNPEYDLLSDIPPQQSIIAVLLDGLGVSYLERLPETSFLRSSHRQTCASVFPSTTASAMTSLATGLPPAEHGIAGRYSYDAATGTLINTLAFRDRFSGELLTPAIPVESLWPRPSFIANAEIPAYTVIPGILQDTTFDSYLCGKGRSVGYESVKDAVDKTIRRVQNAKGRTFHFLYIWELDSIGHKEGTKSDRIDSLLQLLDREMERLSRQIRGRAAPVIFADHGQIDAGETFIITPEHKLMSFLETPPYGEPRASQLLVKPGRAAEFEAYFNDKFGSCFNLLPIPVNAELFGGGSFSQHAANSFADYLAVARGAELLIYTEGSPSDARVHRGEHGGLLPDERLIPLIIPE